MYEVEHVSPRGTGLQVFRRPRCPLIGLGMHRRRTAVRDIVRQPQNLLFVGESGYDDHLQVLEPRLRYGEPVQDESRAKGGSTSNLKDRGTLFQASLPQPTPTLQMYQQYRESRRARSRGAVGRLRDVI